MEVARPPGRGFLMPHQMICHDTRRRPATSPAPPPAIQRRRPRVVRMRTAPHEFYDDGTMTATRSVLGDAAAAASFAAWPMRRVPAAASAVAGLPETTAVRAGGGEEACCAVCLEAYAAGDALRTMPCAHAFHAGCIVELLSLGAFCPLCRFRLPTQAEDDAAQAQLL